MSAGHHGVRRYRALTAAAIGLIAVGCTIGVLVPAGRGWDFANFYDAGHRVAAGQAADLYHQTRSIAGQPPQGQMRFWGAPLSAAIFAPLALLRPDVALVVFKLQNIAALVAAMALLYRHCRRFIADDPDHRSQFAAVFAVLCLLYQPFWTVFRVGGQSTPTVLLALVAALFCYISSHLRTAALLMVGAAMMKPSLILMLVFLACAADLSFVAALGVAGFCLGILSVLALGWPIHVEFLRVLVEGSQFARPWQFNSSLYVPLENLRILAFTPDIFPRTSIALSVVVWCLRCAVAATIVLILRRSDRHKWSTPARRHFEFLMAVCFWLLVSQTIWEHYLAILFLPLAYMVAVRYRFPPAAHGLLAAIFALSLGQNLVLMEFLWTHFDIRSVAALIAIGLVKAGPLLLTLTLLWRHQDSLFASYNTTEWTRPVPVSTSPA